MFFWGYWFIFLQCLCSFLRVRKLCPIRTFLKHKILNVKITINIYVNWTCKFYLYFNHGKCCFKVLEVKARIHHFLLTKLATSRNPIKCMIELCSKQSLYMHDLHVIYTNIKLIIYILQSLKYYYHIYYCVVTIQYLQLF